METNEMLKMALVQKAEAAIVKIMEQLEKVVEGDLNTLEQTVMSTCLAVEQQWLEAVLNHPRAENLGECSHGGAPFDSTWGIEAGRSSPGVQKPVSYLGASMTLEKAATAFQAIFPLKMSARQVLNLMEPVGEALICQEDSQKECLFQEATKKQTVTSAQEKEGQEAIERLYIEMDGVLARMRRSVFGKELSRQASWASYACELLSEGSIEKLVAEIVALPAVPPEPEAARSIPEIEADYFRTNAQRMRYLIFHPIFY